MDSRIHNHSHNQRQRGRLRVSRAFTPPQQHQHQHQHHQYLQQLPAAPSSHFLPQQHPIQHRLDHFPHAGAPAAAVPLEAACDYALLAYRQRINGLFPSHPAEMVPPHLGRNQNIVWPQAQRPQGFNGNDSRLPLSDDFGRQGAFDRDYRDARDDLRSLSELDSSRRSAALSAKLFLDDVQSGFQRGAPFESGQAVEFNRHQANREQGLAQDSLFSKSSERAMERGVRKRNREEVANMDPRAKALRQRKFQDPGLATLPRTPESLRDLPLGQRKHTSGCFADGDDRLDRALSPHKRRESLISPAKRTKKKLLRQQRKTVSDACYTSGPKLKRSDDPKVKPTSANDPIDSNVRMRKFHGQEGDKNLKGNSCSPQTLPFAKTSTQMGVDINARKNKPDDSEGCSVNKSSGMIRASEKGTANTGQEAREQSPNQELASMPSRPIRKSLITVESTPRSKNLKARLLRLLGSDAKVCGASTKIREDGREGNTREPQMTSCQEVLQEDVLQSNNSKETDITVKQEQLVVTEKSGPLLTPTTVELPISLQIPCQNFTDLGSESTKDKEFGHGHEREQIMMYPKVHISDQEKAHPCWLTTLETNNKLSAGRAVITSQPSIMQTHEQFERKQGSSCPFLTLSVDIDVDRMEKRAVQPHQSAMIGGSSSCNSLLSRREMVIPLKASDTEGMVLDLEEAAAECEVRLFGKYLKAPVAKVRVGSPQHSGTPDSSVSAVSNPTFLTSQLSLKHQFGSVSLFSNEKEAEADLPLSLTPQAAVDSKVSLDAGFEEEEGTVMLLSNHASLNSAMQISVCNLQENITSSFQKLSEKGPNLGNVPESTSVLSVLPPESPVINLVDIDSNSSPSDAPQLEVSTVISASDHQEILTGMQSTTMNATSGIPSGPELLKDSLPMKGLVMQEDRPEAFLEHQDRLDASSIKKPMSYMLPKAVGVLHPQARAQKLPGRAGANTWRRSVDNCSFSSSQVVSKLPLDKHLPKAGSQKVSEAAAYVRKGNSLVRAPIASITNVASPLNPSVVFRKDLAGKGFANALRGPLGSLAAKNAVKNTTQCSFKQSFPSLRAELQETAAKAVSGDKLSVAAGEEPGSLHTGPKATLVMTSEKQHSGPLSGRVKCPEESRCVPLVEANNSDLVASIQPRTQLPTNQSASVSLLPDSSASLYVKSKANQLIAAVPINVSEVASCPTNSSTKESYFKTNTNQLVRNSTDTPKKPVEIQTSSREMHQICQSTLKKGFGKRSYPSSSRVWTLKDGSCSSQVKSVLPLLFPWKRLGFGLTACSKKSKAIHKAKKGSLMFLISKRLQRLRKLQPVYSRSVGGFAIHRSGVLSLSGANLKWTKSIEKRSKQASEDATKAVAAVEKQHRKEKKAAADAANGVTQSKAKRKLTREASHGRGRIVTIGLARYKMDPLRRTLQRLRDQRYCDAEVKQTTKSAILSTPRRLCYDGNEYVRVGNGHKLVRDPKAATRALANEKVRWSLHTARSRQAKKQQYCLFFTRFGKCNKSEGGCPYIHDPEKIAVCTKFLKGSCSGTNCLFSHKVIPERMPDCSFFLEGLCTNLECPYRHVCVNPKAPICEGFLKGFCADGDECNKKHTSVCPSFLATGECLDKSRCKLHHPKRKCKRTPKKPWKPKSKRRRRYFGNESSKSVECSQAACFDGVSSVDDFGGEFIAVPEVIGDLEEDQEFKRKLAFIEEYMPIPQEIFQGESNMLLRPIRLLQQPASA